MCMAAAEVIRQSICELSSGASDVSVNTPTVIILLVVIVVKIALYLWMKGVKSPSVEAIAQGEPPRATPSPTIRRERRHHLYHATANTSDLPHPRQITSTTC